MRCRRNKSLLLPKIEPRFLDPVRTIVTTTSYPGTRQNWTDYCPAFNEMGQSIWGTTSFALTSILRTQPTHVCKKTLVTALCLQTIFHLSCQFSPYLKNTPTTRLQQHFDHLNDHRLWVSGLWHPTFSLVVTSVSNEPTAAKYFYPEKGGSRFLRNTYDHKTKLNFVLIHQTLS